MTGPLAYIGGKNRIAKTIIASFPPHTTYVEVFAGGAQVFFRKETSPVEVLNDLDGDVVNFFRVCQRHTEELIRHLKFTLKSRQWFTLLEAENPTSLTDVERASRFFYLQKNCFAGLVKKRKYSYAVAAPANFNPGSIPKLLEAAHRRLHRVQIENLPYQEIVKRFDREDSLFYLDPPYFGRSLYRYNFSEDNFRELAQLLGAIKGKFVLSINDVPQVREIFRDFPLREIQLHYTAQREAGKRFPELLITNFA